MAESKTDYSPAESRKRMEAALRGARIVGHKPLKGPAKPPKPMKPDRKKKAQ